MNQPTPNTLMQRTAKALLATACVMLVLGVSGAAVVKGEAKYDGRNAIRFVDDVAAAKAASREVPAAAAAAAADRELMHGSTMLASATGTTATPPTLAPAALPSSVHGRHVRQVWMLVTAYCPCTICCGPNAIGLTASGRPVSFNGGKFVAADTDVLPMNSTLVIPGYNDGAAVQVVDRGGAIKGNHIDVFFPTHQQALDWGRQWIRVTVIE